MKDCWSLLDLTSRSFAAVIKELKGDLSRCICLFYLVLRALDTIEDDMTLSPEIKIPLLLDFHKKLYQPGWNFTESGPNEKDRQLLVEFDKVIEEFNLLGEGYKTVIADICAKMGAGMASYIEASSKSPLTVNSYEDWELYCHFVAGLVGEGLSRLFSESGLERDWLGNQLDLSNHMGLFLQKVNIIRDYAEDSLEERFFWPKQCWGDRFGFATQPDVAKGIVETSPGSKQFQAVGEEGARGMGVLSTLLLDALRHSTRALDYLAMLKEQSVFNFCAIPQTMAIATIDLMVNNPNVLRRNVKIRKSQAVGLILRSTNPRDVSLIFKDFANSIHKKIPVSDVNYVEWQVELARIHMWCEHYYPSYVALGGEDSTSTAKDVRAVGIQRWSAQRSTMAIDLAQKKGVDLFNSKNTNKLISSGGAALVPGTGEKRMDPRLKYMSVEEVEKQDKKDRDDAMYFFAMIMGFLALVFCLVALVGWYIAWYLTVEDETDPLTLLILRGYGKIKELVKGGSSGQVGFTQDPIGWGQQHVATLRQKFEL